MARPECHQQSSEVLLQEASRTSFYRWYIQLNFLLNSITFIHIKRILRYLCIPDGIFRCLLMNVRVKWVLHTFKNTAHCCSLPADKYNYFIDANRLEDAGDRLKTMRKLVCTVSLLIQLIKKISKFVFAVTYQSFEMSLIIFLF